MNTPLYHPQRQKQQQQFYPFVVAIKDVDWQAVAGLESLPCTYQAGAGGEVETYELEAPTQNRILLRDFVANVRPGLRAVLIINEQTKRFIVDDVLPVAYGTQSLLIVTPTA